MSVYSPKERAEIDLAIDGRRHQLMVVGGGCSGWGVAETPSNKRAQDEATRYVQTHPSEAALHTLSEVLGAKRRWQESARKHIEFLDHPDAQLAYDAENLPEQRRRFAELEANAAKQAAWYEALIAKVEKHGVPKAASGKSRR